MTGGSFDPDETFDTAAADRATVRGLKILFWAGCAAIVIALAWPAVRGLIAPAIVLAIAGFALWRFRGAPLVGAARAWIEALFAWPFERVRMRLRQRPYAHAFEQAAHEEQERATLSELARMTQAENASIATTEAAVFVSQARAAMEERMEQLLAIPKPTLAQHREREQLARWLREDRKHASSLVHAAVGNRQSAVGEPAVHGNDRRPAAGLISVADWRLPTSVLSSVHLWILGALVAGCGFLYARGEKLKVDARRAQEAREALADDRNYWRTRAGRWEKAYADATGALRANAERQARETALSAEHLAAAERRNQRLAQDLRRLRSETLDGADRADPGASLRILSEPLDHDAGAGTGSDETHADPGL